MRRLKRYDLESDEGPRRQDHYREYGIHPAVAPCAEGCNYLAPVDMRQADRCNYQSPRQKDDRKHSIHALQHRLGPDEHQSDAGESRRRDADLTEEYAVACDLVAETDLQHIAEERPDNDEQSCRIQKYYGQIRQDDKPRTDEGVVAPEGFFCVSIYAAYAGPLPDQEFIIACDDQHYSDADHHRQKSPCRACQRKERGPGHDKSAPSDHAAESHRPYIDRGEVSVESPSLDAVVCSVLRHNRPLLRVTYQKLHITDILSYIPRFYGTNLQMQRQYALSCILPLFLLVLDTQRFVCSSATHFTLLTRCPFSFCSRLPSRS